MAQLYIAYGSNTNLAQMAHRCPAAKLLGPGKIIGWKLTFRQYNLTAVANVEPAEGGELPVVCWNIEEQEEKALDSYEGVRQELYRKEYIPVILNGKEQTGLIYIMNITGKLGTPGVEYFQKIKDGYISAGFDPEILKKAYQFSSNSSKTE